MKPVSLAVFTVSVFVAGIAYHHAHAPLQQMPLRDALGPDDYNFQKAWPDEVRDMQGTIDALKSKQPETESLKGRSVEDASKAGQGNQPLLVTTTDKLSGKAILSEYYTVKAALPKDSGELQLKKFLELDILRDGIIKARPSPGTDKSSIFIYGKVESPLGLYSGDPYCIKSVEGTVVFTEDNGLLHKEVDRIEHEVNFSQKPCQVVSKVERWTLVVDEKTGEITERKVRTNEKEQQEFQKAADEKVAAVARKMGAAQQVAEELRRSRHGQGHAQAKMNAIFANANEALKFQDAIRCASELLTVAADGVLLLDKDCPSAAEILRHAVVNTSFPTIHNPMSVGADYDPHITRLRNAIKLAGDVVDSDCP